LIEPVTVNEPDKVMSYASVPENASMDCVTWYASTVWPVVIPFLSNIFAIYIFNYTYAQKKPPLRGG
jgi:hypothetical protein